MRYGNVELINADASKPDLLIDCSVENRPSSSVVYFKTATLDGSVRVVPPPQEWNVFSLQEHQKLTHLSVWIERLVTKFPNQLDGLIGATISHKHRLGTPRLGVCRPVRQPRVPEVILIVPARGLHRGHQGVQSIQVGGPGHVGAGAVAEP
eukprot:scaffold7225_cov379-Prasinococcus_capsulatus_cf.AAC.5